MTQDYVAASIKPKEFMQEQTALDTRKAWQHAKQPVNSRNPEDPGMAAESIIDSISNSTAHRSLRQESKTGISRGEMPVFRLPGVQIKLPTAVGVVSFSPLFLSKKQLDRTWVSTDLHPFRQRVVNEICHVHKFSYASHRAPSQAPRLEHPGYCFSCW